MVRLFVALQISEEIRTAMVALGHKLKPLDDSWKWTRTENLHVTLKFLGEIPSDKLESVRQALRGVPGEWPIEVKFSRLGFFPNEWRPRVLWGGMETGQRLPALGTAIEGALAKVGVPRDEREFTPHLTLARNKSGSISQNLRETITKLSMLELGT